MTNRFNIGDRVVFSPNCEGYEFLSEKEKNLIFEIWYICFRYPDTQQGYILKNEGVNIWVAKENEICKVIK